MQTSISCQNWVVYDATQKLSRTTEGPVHVRNDEDGPAFGGKQQLSAV